MKKIKAFFHSFTVHCVAGIFFVISLPGSMLRGIFYTADLDPEGNVIRTRFSITRAAFTMATGLMLFRILLASIDVDSVEVGTLCIEKAKHAAHATKAMAPRKGKPSGERKPKSKKNKKKKPRVYIKGYKGKPLAWTEIWMYVVIVGLYYFHRDINRGSEAGVLKQLIQILVEAQMLRQGMQPPAVASESVKTITSVTEETVVASSSQVAPKLGGKEKPQEIPKSADPFL